MKENRKKILHRFTMLLIIAVILIGCDKKSDSEVTSGDNSSAKVSTGTENIETTVGTDNTDNTADSQTTSTSAANGGFITPETQDHVDVLKVPNYDWIRIADSKGWFKEAFPDTEIQIVEGVTGKEIQLFERRELFFANRMLYPTLLYAKEGANFKMVSISGHPTSPIGSVIVKADSPYKTLSDLKGKKIASWRASCPYMILIELVSREGWKEGKDWKFINVPSTDLKTALLAGEVDALVFHANGDFAQLLVSGEGREIAQPAADSVYINGGGVVVDFVPTSFLEEHAAIVHKYLELKTLTNQWIYENEKEAAALIESITRVPADVSTEWWDRSYETTIRSTLSLEEIKKEILITEDWLVEDGDIKASERVDWDSYFADGFFQ